MFQTWENIDTGAALIPKMHFIGDTSVFKFSSLVMEKSPSGHF